MKKSKPQPHENLADAELKMENDGKRTSYERALHKLNGRDAVGRAGELLGTAGGVAAGASAAGAIAGAAGATTLLGSGALASVFGGIFVVTTPVGWVVGCAAVAGITAYGVARLARSGGRQDEVRARLSHLLERKLAGMDGNGFTSPSLSESGVLLREKISEAVASGAMTEANQVRMLGLIDRGALSIELSLDRIEKILVASKDVNFQRINLKE